MLNGESTLRGLPLRSSDAHYVGSIKDLYFDDRYWAIRYLVADTGLWLPNRKVLISPRSLGFVSIQSGTVAVDLTRKQIEDSPSLDSEQPVSRQFEELYNGYYGWPAYWTGPYERGTPPLLMRESTQVSERAVTDANGDPHLRSANAVRGHHLEATDGSIGHIADFLIDDENWVIRYLVIHTSNWWPTHKVLLSPEWVDSVSWPEAKAFVNLKRDVIKNAPSYSPDNPVTRDFETRLHQYYQRPGYWHNERAASRLPNAEGL